MASTVRGLWTVVLSGYPRAGKTTLANRLVADYPYFARVGVDELRVMLFNEVYPSRDEFLIYSMISEMRDSLPKDGYNIVIDSTAPDNVTRQFLLTTKVKPVNQILVILNVDKDILIERNTEKFGDAYTVFVYDNRWETPKHGIAVFKFKSNSP